MNGNQTLPDGVRFDKRAGWSHDEGVEKVKKRYRLLLEDRYSLSEINRLVGWERGGTRTLANPVWKAIRAYPATADREAFEVRIALPQVVTDDEWARAQTLLSKRSTWTKETR